MANTRAACNESQKIDSSQIESFRTVKSRAESPSTDSFQSSVLVDVFPRLGLLGELPYSRATL